MTVVIFLLFYFLSLILTVNFLLTGVLIYKIQQLDRRFKLRRNLDINAINSVFASQADTNKAIFIEFHRLRRELHDCTEYKYEDYYKSNDFVIATLDNTKPDMKTWTDFVDGLDLSKLDE